MAKNANLQRAKNKKNDEFYTRYEDIEKELVHYKEHFLGKVVYLPCDDMWSNFWRYFVDHFAEYGLRKLIASHYEKGAETVITHSYDGENISETEINGDGDFRSEAVTPLWNEADIVVTNPPFSLFREFMAQLVKYDKKYLIIGHQNAITYKEIFPLIKENKLWLGYGFKGNAGFFKSPYKDTAKSGQHKEGFIRVSGVMWFTNLDIPKRHEDLILVEKYNPEKYPKYDNYDAINVDKTADIPCDFAGIMGVPITFMDKYNPDQFDLIDVLGSGLSAPIINGQCKFKRILIQKKRAALNEPPFYYIYQD